MSKSTSDHIAALDALRSRHEQQEAESECQRQQGRELDIKLLIAIGRFNRARAALEARRAK